jgi:hypothetical protein
METRKLGSVGRLWMLRLVRHGGGSAAEKVGGPAGGKPRCHLLLLFSKSMRLWGSEKERETETELKELVFEETHWDKERKREFLSFFLEVFNELDSFFMIITES